MREGLPAPPTRKTVQAYGDGGFTVESTPHRGSLILFADQLFSWPVTDFSQVTLDSLAPVTDGSGAEILVLGCGPAMQWVSPDFRESLRRAGLVVEPMDTGAACRTFNLLVAEDRRVAAALIAV